MKRTHKKEGDIPPQDRVVSMDIIPEMKESYLDYAMSVIVSRALPDIRDGLKPVHRRILYAMHEMGLTSGVKTRKSAAIVGTVIANYHPHGDTAVYDTLVKMAQTFTTRYPLVIGQGNFGSIDGDAPAAMRYTEAKMSQITGLLLRDIEKDTVPFRPNFENVRMEPVVLPAQAPNLLLNGTLGIAVGMATKIPPHNFGEVIDALIHLANHPRATSEDIFEIIKGPDFPTGGVVFNKKDIQHAYASGRGGILTRGEIEIVDGGKSGTHLVITSLPYQVNKSELIVKIADLVHGKKIEGIRDIRDESTDDIRIVIELKGGGHPQKIVNALYKHTELETMFHLNMLALVGGVPKLLSLKDILDEFITHREVVVTRRTTFDLARAEERAHILLGLKKALDNIDAIIKTIKASRDTTLARENLKKKFSLSDAQATAILEMKLQRLAGLEREKVEEELKEKKELIKKLKEILSDPKKIREVIRDEFLLLKDRHSDPRRTKIMAQGVKNISIEDMIPDVENMLVLTNGGYIKRTDPSEYRKQKRGGSGVIDLDTKEEDFVNILLSAHTHSDLLFFSDKGKVYQVKMYDVPEGRRATKGKSVMNFLAIAEGEKITSVLPVPKNKKKASVIMVTNGGVVKKVDAGNFADVRRSGIIAIKLGKGDKLLSALMASGDDDVSLITAKGQSIRFLEKDVRQMGRSAAGVRGMKLLSGDHVIAAVLAGPSESAGALLVLSTGGYGKRTKLKEYKVQKRGGSGIKTAKLSAKTGTLVGAAVIGAEEKDILVISREGQIIRIGASEVPTLSRQTQGVRIMKVKSGDALASFACL